MDHTGASCEPSYEPEIDYYASRDSWYTQSQANRPCLDTVWGHQIAGPMTVTGMSAAVALAEPPHRNNDSHQGAQRHPIPLDAPDVALKGQRLLVYGERLHHKEAGIVSAEPGRARPTARPLQPPLGRHIPEVRERPPPAPHMADQIEDIGEIVHLR